MSGIIDLDAERARRERQVEVRTLGPCRLGEPTVADLRRLHDRLWPRPAQANHAATVNELISFVVREPMLTPDDVARLPSASRRRLRTEALIVCGAAGDYRRLRGSHLSLDERAVTALRWAAGRRAREIRTTVARLAERRAQLARAPVHIAARSRSPTGVGGAVLGRSTRSLDLLSGVSRPLRRFTDVTRQLGMLHTNARRLSFAGAVADELPALTGRGLGLAPGATDVLARGIAAGAVGNPATSMWRAARTPSLASAIADASLVGGIRRMQRDGLAGFGAGGIAAAVRMQTLTVRPVSGVLGARGDVLGALTHLGVLRTPEPWRRLTGIGALTDLTRTAAGWLREHTPILIVFEQLLPRFAAGPLAWIVEVVSLRAAVALMRVEADAGLDALLDEIALALVEEDVLDAFAQTLATAGALAPYNRQWLHGGLGALRGEPDWIGAAPLLTLGVEGAYRDLARAEGLIVQRRARDLVVLPGGQTRGLNGIEALFEYLALDADRVTFLRQRAYGGPGNELRHALVQDRSAATARRHVGSMLLALGICPERFVDAGAMDIAAVALEAHADRLDAPVAA